METPKIYVADLEAYNSGRLVGKWFDLDDYSDADELVEAIEEYMTSLGKEEYAIHDIENFPREFYSEYMGKSDFEQVYEIMEKAKEFGLPLEVVSEFAREYSIDAVDSFQDKYDDMSDFAYKMVEEWGIDSFSNPESYMYVSETDKRIIAGEEGDNFVDNSSDKEIIEEADMDFDEYQEADEEAQEKMLEEAKDTVREQIYEEWYEGLDSPYDFLVNEKGMYAPKDLKNASFVQIDYEKLGRDLEYDYNTIEYDGKVYVFRTDYAKGGFLSRLFGGGKKEYNRSWHQDHYQVNKAEKWERQDGMRHGKKARNRYEDGGQMSMFARGGNTYNRSWHQDHYNVNKEESWERQDGVRHGKTARNRYDKGGTIDILGNRVSDYDLEKLQGNGMTIKELREFFKSRFPDSFSFSLGTFKTMEDMRVLKPNPDDPFKGIENNTLKLSFDRFHSMGYRIYQGGENTYFYFLLTGSDDNAYLGQFGFKDEGDVPKEYITSFVSLLHKLYDFPFNVSHEIYAKGGKTYNRSWHQDHYNVNKEESWERQDGMRHGKTARNRYAKGGETSKKGSYSGRIVETEMGSVMIGNISGYRGNGEPVYDVHEYGDLRKDIRRKVGELGNEKIKQLLKSSKYAKGGSMDKTGMINLIFNGKPHKFDANFEDGKVAEVFLPTNPDSELFQFIESQFLDWIDDNKGRDIVDMYYSEDAIYDKRGAIVESIYGISSVMEEENLTTLNLDKDESDMSASWYAKGGKLKSYKYVPNRNIESVTLTQGEGTITIPQDNILDGVYIRKRYKAFGRGGNTGNYNEGLSWKLDRKRFAKKEDYEVQYRKHK